MSPAVPSPAKPRKPKLKHLTWEHPKGSGIKIAEMPNKTAGVAYGVSYQVRIPAELLGVPGKRELLQRRTKAEAERLAEDRFVALKKHGTEFSKIPAHAQKQAALAWGMLSEHNEQTKLALNFIDVMKAGIASLSPTGGLRTFAEVAAELRASKAARFAAGGLDVQTERGFRKRSEKLEATLLGAKLVSQTSTNDVTSVLAELAKDYSQRSVLNYRTILAEVFRYAKAKAYSPTNPMDGITSEEAKALGGMKPVRDFGAINILRVDEARRLLDACAQFVTNARQERNEEEAQNMAGLLATAALRLFCGIRTKEVSLLEWKHVHWLSAKPYVHIPAGIAKKRRIREILIPENALAWLRFCNPPATGKLDPLSPKTYAKRFGRIAQAAGIGKLDAKGTWESEWETNDTRHSFASYHFALHENAMLTAGQMGHKQDDTELFAHYRTLVRKPDAEAFFSLIPQDGRANVVTAFPQAASAS